MFESPQVGALWGLIAAGLVALVWVDKMVRSSLFDPAFCYRLVGIALSSATFAVWLLVFFFPSFPMPTTGTGNEGFMMLVP